MIGSPSPLLALGLVLSAAVSAPSSAPPDAGRAAVHPPTPNSASAPAAVPVSGRPRHAPIKPVKTVDQAKPEVEQTLPAPKAK